MALSFQNILVPYDGTKTGDKAFNGAMKIAKNFGSKVTVLSCIEREPTFVFFETKADKQLTNKRNKVMNKKISNLEDIADKLGVNLRSTVTNCSVASKCIVSYIKSHKVDLVVMGKSSKINPEKIYHDSTVNYVYNHVNCAMLNV